MAEGKKNDLSAQLQNMMIPEVLQGNKDTSLQKAREMETSLSANVRTARDEQLMRDALQSMMKQQQNNPTMMLNASARKQQNATITSAVAQGVKQAADSNQEEYGTVARHALGKRGEDLAYVAMRGIHNNIYNQSMKYRDSALEYSKTKGGMAMLQSRGTQLTSQLNGMNVKDRFAKPYTLEDFNKQSGNIYSNTLAAGDGKLHLTYENVSGGYAQKTSVDLGSKIGERKANDLLTDIGSYHDSYLKQQRSIEVLTGTSAHAGTNYSDSWENLVSGNFQALDQQFDFVQRYNNHIRAEESANKAVRKVQETVGADATIRNFTGSKEDVQKLRNAVDSNGEHIFSQEELSALEECVQACGYSQPAGNRRVLENASERARRRFASSMLDDTQAAGVHTLTSAMHVAKTTKNLASAASGIGEEFAANLADRQTRKLVDKVSRTDQLSGGRLEAAQKRLAKKKEKLGLETDKDLLGRTKKIRENAVERREKKRELRSMTRGMNRTQARIALNQLKQEERLLKHKRPSRLLSKQTERLQKKLARQQKIKSIRKRLTPKLATKTRNKLTSSLAGKAFGKLAGALNAVSVGLKIAAKYIAIAVAIVIAVVFLAAGVDLIFMLVVYPFTEDNGNTDMAGNEANDLQIVNEAMSLHEAEQMAALKGNIETVTKANYIKRPEYDGHADASYEGGVRISSNSIKYRGKWYPISGCYIKEEDGTFTEITYAQAGINGEKYYESITVDGEDIYFEYAGTRIANGAEPDMSVEVEADYEVYDEFGRETSICNCMQLISLYRYYYLFIHDGDEAEAEDYWIREFKDGRMMDAWDRTHSVSVKGDFKEAHTSKWSDGLPYENLIVEGTLPGSAVYHSGAELSQCTNAGTYSYWVYPPMAAPYQIFTTCCFGHVKSMAKVQVDTKLETLASGRRLRTASGWEITWDTFEDEDACGFLNDFLGSYEEYYMPGYEMYAEYEIYFGNAAQMLTSADMERIVGMIEEKYGTLSPMQRAVIMKGLEGCGRFNYSKASHANCGFGVQGGATDCSGYVSWVHNNCGLYQNTSICNSTQAWSQAPGYKTGFDLHNLSPGDLIVRGAPGAPADSPTSPNHVVIWLGFLTDESGNTQPWVIECGGGHDGSACGPKPIVRNYKTAIPLGSSDTW